MWDAKRIRALRKRLGLDPAAFGRLVGADVRSVYRWEAGPIRPTGAAEAVLNGIDESLKSSDNVSEIIQVLVGAAAIGGLAFLLVKLLSKKK